MDARIGALTVVLFSVCATPVPEAQAKSNACIPGSLFDPANPTSAGYSLVFSDDFTNPQTIDLNATGNPGFNWYLTKFFGYGTEPASTIAFTQDGLVLTPSSAMGGNWNIATAAPATNSQGYVGKAFGGGAYFEAKIKFDPTSVNFSQGFPAFWGFSIEHAANKGADHPPGTQTGFQHFIEDDFFEYDISWASSTSYGTAIHDWYGIYTSTCQEGHRAGLPGFCDVTNNGVGTNYNNFVSAKQNNAAIDWTQWHTIGQLWVPGNSRNRAQGYVQNFIDGQAANAGAGTFAPLSKTGWKDAAAAFIDPLNSSTAFSVLDSNHLMIILGTGPGQPFTVGYVKVWQIPGCAK
ncbi:MAG: hypothetical protein ACT4O2_03635 [Beijerinckiaceae bacterium]